MTLLLRNKPISLARTLLGFALAIITGCASAPVIHLHELQSRSIQSSPTDDRMRLQESISAAQGLQDGDQIFANGTSCYWILPEIDLLQLRITALAENLDDDEIAGRFSQLKSLHDQFLIFVLDLKIPFSPQLAASEVERLLADNLILTVENDRDLLVFPKSVGFRSRELFLQTVSPTDDSSAEILRLPIRILFPREKEGVAVVEETVRQLIFTMRLQQRLPFQSGFFDENFLQSFRWKVRPSNGDAESDNE